MAKKIIIVLFPKWKNGRQLGNNDWGIYVRKKNK